MVCTTAHINVILSKQMHYFTNFILLHLNVIAGKKRKPNPKFNFCRDKAIFGQFKMMHKTCIALSSFCFTFTEKPLHLYPQ